MDTKKSFEDTMKFVTMVAAKQGWGLHPDTEFLSDIVDGLTVNFNRYGYFACPCRDSSGKREEDKDIICPCAYCVPDQEEFGHCYCGLYLSKSFAALGGIPQGIPERRFRGRL